MRSLDDGESPVLAVRVPAELNERIERWAAARGEEVADGLRALIRSAADGVPDTGLVVRPPRRTMLRSLRHSCFDRRRTRPPEHCGQEWSHHPENWAVVRVTEGPRWSSLDDLMRATVENSLVLQEGGFRVPSRYLQDLAAAFRGQENRLSVHHLNEGQGPFLVHPDGE